MSPVAQINTATDAQASVTRTHAPQRSYLDDVVLLGVMPSIAGCGLVYEYALSHYAGVVLGNTETAIFIMIGIMIMSAGFGSLVSQRIPQAFVGMVWLEIAMIVVGVSAIPAIAAMVYVTKLFDIAHFTIKNASVGLDALVPFVYGFVMGFLMGMEMPLVARVREQIRGAEGARGTAIVYAIDCIGIAAGTFAWAAYLGDIDVTRAATLAASVNAIALTIFVLRYRARISFQRGIVLAIVVAATVLGVISAWGTQWSVDLAKLAGV